jgi:hypothetical protein
MNRENKTSALLWTLLFASLFLPTTLQADPCSADLETFCSDRAPGMGAISTCLQQNIEKLSHGCRERLKKIDATMQRKANACISDARDYCRDVKPGYGRIKNCLMANLDKLSTGCQEALK